ncbi:MULTISPECIES: CHASE2 domain-containing protein [unclassified Coleofasciculus]|uniref:CHASE2 domain-containing protein n=1 Tax=unclassified Coleofasciculus TaxID=2692782 RepID=UPI0018816929|nr:MULTISPECIES: CHASE2 domain-containing protein [unclassified Coleofasciculus]MBE9127882.1 CHASE2 domain-containing protein [Coleofasciculus sp. LEGE 07081]MBE9151074.1 CHASE2 domain-containing protein [Coleofasciculus sp. LEGE 07092]
MISKFFEKFRSLTTFGGTVILTSAVVTGVIVGVRQLGGLEGLELRTYDQLMRSRPEPGSDDRMLVVGISEEDIQQMNAPNIPDGTLAELLQKLEEYQPRVIGIDILRDVKVETGREQLVKVLQENENIIAACKLSSPTEPGNPAAPGVPEERIGFADLPLDRDVAIRRAILVSIPFPTKVAIENPHYCNYVSEENQIPSFALNTAMVYLEGKDIYLDQTEEGNLALGSAVFKPLEEQSGGYYSTRAEDYQIMINYRSGQNAVEQVTLTDVLEGKVDPNLVKDRVVMVGYTATTKNDDFATPYSAGGQDRVEMPGVVIHAQIASQILASALEGRPSIWYWSGWGEVLWIFGWSVVGGTLAWKIRRPWILVPAGIGAIAVLYGASYALFLQAGWIPLVPPALALVVTAGGVILIDRYAQAVYKGVKKLLKIDIDIDHSEKERQVAEITENETFQELQAKAKELRRRKSTPTVEESTTEDIPPVINESPEVQPTEPKQEDESASPDDYLQQLQRRGKRMKKKEDDHE